MIGRAVSHISAEGAGQNRVQHTFDAMIMALSTLGRSYANLRFLFIMREALVRRSFVSITMMEYKLRLLT